MRPDNANLLEVRDLRVHFPTEDGLVKSVDGLSFDVRAGEILGIVGESGSGKSVASRAVLGLHKGGNARVSGEIWYMGRELVAASERDMRGLRGSDIAMIFQDPMSSLHPYLTIGRQISEAYLVHNRVSRKRARAHTVDMLDRVGIPNASRRYDAYAHEFSGGMRQRVMIAMALCCGPKLLIADEPTSALDVTVQAQILSLITDLRDEFQAAVILITHDLGVVAETCDRVVVMYAGRCVELASVTDIFNGAEMPYTWGLLGSMPRIDETRQRLDPIPGHLPSLIDLPAGCAFAGRCTYQESVQGHSCVFESPELIDTGGEHWSRCHLDLEYRSEIWRKKIAPLL